jgi:hypothetical protein
MSSTTMALGSQPASMPAESNLDQMTHLISPARSELSEIDPSWEILPVALAAANIRLRHYFILSLCLLDLCSSFY